MAEGLNFNCQRLPEVLLEPFQGRFYNRFVLLIRVINARAVLNSPVVSLFVDGNRINNGVIPFQKKGQTEFFRVKYYFYRFRMARFPAAYFFIRGRSRGAVGISHFRFLNAGHQGEVFFHSPETASRQVNRF